MVNINTKFHLKKMDSGLCCNNIVLIGFMGSGKNSIGALLAQKLGRIMLDCDSLIEHNVQMTIKDIFKIHGEHVFREYESKLVDWLACNVQNAVIATGGGLPIFTHGINRLGVVLYLDVDFDVILQRLTDEERAKRPLFADIDKAHALYQKRAALYQHIATHSLDANVSCEEIVHKAWCLLKEKGLI